MKSQTSHNHFSDHEKVSPGRKQYLDIKSSYKNELLLYRMGDFYETFDDDAVTLSSVLGVALTKRDVGSNRKSNLAGIPVNSLENYIKTLLDAGLTIAIAEQTSDPSEKKGIVDREVVRIVTPGTVFESSILDESKNSYVLAVYFARKDIGISWVDVTTGQFYAQEIQSNQLKLEIERLQPNEIVIFNVDKNFFEEINISNIPIRFIKENKTLYVDDQKFLNKFSDYIFRSEISKTSVLAAYLAYKHIESTLMGDLPQIKTINFETNEGYMTLDGRSLKDLEIFTSSGSGQSLFDCMNLTKTSMGTRLLRNWLSRPLYETKKINDRLDSVSLCLDNYNDRSLMLECLTNVSDIERLINRVISSISNPRDLISLKNSLISSSRLPNLSFQILKTLRMEDKFPDNSESIDLISLAIDDNPGVNPGDGNVIKSGFNQELDDLNSLLKDTSKAINILENKIKNETGIKNLKIGFNRVFGYYIEVTRSHLSNLPETFQPRQSLVNSERFITVELKELENKILSAKDKITVLEKQIYNEVCTDLVSYSDKILILSNMLAHLDVISSFALTSLEEGWVRPTVNRSLDIKIKHARHPIVEKSIPKGDFVPNHVDISESRKRICIITGPNMAGKSTYIRQIGIICIMAQSGSFIPAESGDIGIVDRIFTRAGLGDDISAGQSTFMVEMIETAEILNYATKSSLAIMDEVGRGTSTYDGLAIARAVVEYLHDSKIHGCRTLFATHFHEMADLTEVLPNVNNLKVSVSEETDGIVFLRTIIPGGSDKSYGVHVAKLAGMPKDVLNRSWGILKQLEHESNSTIHPLQIEMNLSDENEKNNQLLENKLLDANLDQMTPIEALNMLNMLKNEINKDNEQ